MYCVCGQPPPYCGHPPPCQADIVFCVLSVCPGLGSGGGTGRKLQQAAADVTTQLADVLLRVDTLRDAQSGITGQLNALQSQVDKANLLAEARAASTTIQDLIAGEGWGRQGGRTLELVVVGGGGLCCTTIMAGPVAVNGWAGAPGARPYMHG